MSRRPRLLPAQVAALPDPVDVDCLLSYSLQRRVHHTLPTWRRRVAAPKAGEPVRLVEELQERESLLRIELLEHKILKETVAIITFLEKDLAAKSRELGRCKDALTCLEAENVVLRTQLNAAMASASCNEQRILEMAKLMAICGSGREKLRLWHIPMIARRRRHRNSPPLSLSISLLVCATGKRTLYRRLMPCRCLFRSRYRVKTEDIL